MKVSERVIETLGWLGLAGLVLLPLIFYADLPAQIPLHYGFSGWVDRIGSKQQIWVLSVLGMMIYFFLHFIQKRPYAVMPHLRGEQAESREKILRSQRLALYIKVAVVWIFLYVLIMTLRTAMGEGRGLGWYFGPVVLLILAMTIYAAERR